MDSFKIVKAQATVQDPVRRSFQGGSPVMPAGVDAPRCRLCSAELSFFFQVEFPPNTAWAGRTLCMFACTSCQDLTRAVPIRPPSYAVENVTIPDGYIQDYQVNFRTVVFDRDAQAVLRADIAPRFEHQPFELAKLRGDNKSFESKIGGRPYGLYERQVPTSYMGSAFVFLLQIQGDWTFRVRPGTPPAPGIGGVPDEEGALFWGLPTYFSGTTDLNPPQVWLLTYS